MPTPFCIQHLTLSVTFFTCTIALFLGLCFCQLFHFFIGKFRCSPFTFGSKYATLPIYVQTQGWREYHIRTCYRESPAAERGASVGYGNMAPERRTEVVFLTLRLRQVPPVIADRYVHVPAEAVFVRKQ